MAYLFAFTILPISVFLGFKNQMCLQMTTSKSVIFFFCYIGHVTKNLTTFSKSDLDFHPRGRYTLAILGLDQMWSYSLNKNQIMNMVTNTLILKLKNFLKSQNQTTGASSKRLILVQYTLVYILNIIPVHYNQPNQHNQYLPQQQRYNRMFFFTNGSNRNDQIIIIHRNS